MKILIAHNDYGRPSGEEAAVDTMGKMMKEYGHDISFYRKSTVGHQRGFFSKIRMFVSGVYSGSGIRGIKKVLQKERPDIVHVHNLYPFISPAALFVCRWAGVPIVMTVHNYRLICPTGLFLRNDRPCEFCLQRGDEWGCIKYNCEKNVFKSIGYALRSFVARKIGAYQKNVDRYVCLTVFQKRKLIEAGFKAEKITVIPNSIRSSASEPAASGDYIAYVGRLSPEKGWDLLMEVAEKNPALRIEAAGFVQDKDLQDQVPSNIVFRGHLDEAELGAFYRGARFLVIPSRCYEGFPLVALEAMAVGKPVVAPDHGGFTEIIGKGVDAAGCLFRPNDAADLEAVLLGLWEDKGLVQRLGKKCIEKIKSSYSSEIVYRQWEHLFMELLSSGKN